MTESVSLRSPQTIWVPLPSCIYSSDDHQWPLCWFCQWACVLFYLLLHVVLYWPLLPWNVPFLAFRMPAPHALVHFSSPCPQHPSLACSLPSSLSVDVPQRWTFTLLSSHSTYSEPFWESDISVFTQSVLAARFQVLSRTVLFNIVITSHTWIFKLNILK